MKHIQVLDCTLRDGGYCNECRFGFENEKKIIRSLIEANIDIIECGFLMNLDTYNKDLTKFSSLEQVAEIIPENRKGKLFVVLTDYGKYNPDELPDYDGTTVDGLRIAFHKKDRAEAIEECKKVKEKGYKVFVQAMVSVSYTDLEFLDLIERMNELEPYAFYIVDSFGMMKRKDLIRLFYLVEHNLKKSIKIGFHSHNNMQLAFSNAQSLVETESDRNLIIDSSVYGMGRGAGNLNTELFVDYLNETFEEKYILKPLLSIIDEILNGFYQKNHWGYSLPNYLSAANNTHPNYASFLDDKKTLTVEAMNDIFNIMDDEKKYSFDKDYIEEIYFNYMESGKVQKSHREELNLLLKEKKVLLVAPGKSSKEEVETIKKAAKKENMITISINFDYEEISTEFIFLSNLRRFRELDKEKRPKCIITSNIPSDRCYLKAEYRTLLCEEEAVCDNAGLMAIKFLVNCGVQEIYLAGFDGYTHNANENYGNSQMELIMRNAVLDAMNVGMTKVLKKYMKKVSIQFVTRPRHILI